MPDENIDEQQNVENISLDSNSENTQPEQPTITVNNFTSEPEPIISAPTIATVPIIPVATVIQPVTIVKIQKKHSSILILIIAIILAILVGGGSVLAYTFVYQNPQRVITDSIINAFNAKSPVYTGTISYASKATDNVSVAVEVTAKQVDVKGSLNAKLTINYSGKEYIAVGDALLDEKGDVYFKVSGLATAVVNIKDQLGVQSGTSISDAIDKIVEKVDGVWIKVSSEDLANYSSSYADTKTCVTDAIKEFKTNKTASDEISDLYKKHQFIVIKESLKQQNGSFGYVIEADKTEGKAFSEGLTDTKIYKQLHECDSSFTIDTADISAPAEVSNISALTKASDEVSDSPVTLWVDAWSHKITKVEASSDNSSSVIKLSLMPKYDQTVQITTPSTSITLSDLMTSVTDLVQSVSPTMDPIEDGSF